LDASEATAAWEQADKGVAAARRAADAAEANAAVARSGVDAAKAAVQEAQAANARAAQRKASVEKLLQSGDATEDEHDQVVSDAAIAAARLKSAEAALVSADARVASAQAAVKQAEAAVAVAEAGERLAKITLEKHTIRSPVAGTVEDLPYDLREYVRAGTPVCRIVRTDRLKVIVNCPERDAQFVNAMKQRHEDAVKEDPKAAGRPDEPAAGEKELFRDGQPLIRFKDEQVGFQRYGVIDWVALVADPMTRTYETRILLNNPSGDPANPPIRPGMIATVQIVRRVNRAAVCVPMTAVVTRGQRQVIYLFAPGEDEPNVGTATELAADFGLADPTRIQVVGLPAGSKVIVGWDIEIRTGDAVRVKQWLPGAPAGEDGKAPRISQIHTD
jgi:RND family efflux transporter MFP subunit